MIDLEDDYNKGTNYESSSPKIIQIDIKLSPYRYSIHLVISNMEHKYKILLDRIAERYFQEERDKEIRKMIKEAADRYYSKRAKQK